MRKYLSFAGGVLVIVILAMLMGPTGGYPSRPRFQAVGIGIAAPIAGRLKISSADSVVDWIENDAPADNRQWRINASSEGFDFQAVNDAESASAAFMAIERTGTTIDSIMLAATTIIDTTGTTTHTRNVGESTIQGVGGSSPQVRITNGTVITKLQNSGITSGFVGTESSHPFELHSNNIARVTIAADGSSITHRANSHTWQSSAGTSTTMTSNNATAAARYVVFDGGVMFGSGCFTSTLAASTNNLNPWAGLTGSCLMLDATGAQTLTGLVPQVAAERQMLFLKNIDSADTITISHESVSSTSSNRFDNAGDANLVLTAGSMVICVYQIVSTRWSCTTP